MINYIVYKTTTGEILRTGLCPDDMMEIQSGESETSMEGTANDLTQYIVDEIITNKEENPAIIDKTTMAADGSEITTISGLQNPTICTLEGTDYEVTDGTFEFTIDTAGKYTIICKSFPYLDKEFIVNAS